MPGIPDDSTDSGPLRKPDGWELACAGILRTEFGRRKFNAVAGAMAKLLEDERGHEVPPAGYRWLPWPSPTAWLSLPRLAFAALAICAVLFAAGLLWHGLLKRRLAPVPVCVVSAELNCKWMPGSGHPKIGEAVPGGVLQLESGVMELAFLSKASAVIEGPARFSVAANAMKLQWGTMSAFVRQPARGFSVQMPVATLIDLGTRFGAVVNMDQTARVDVFQGAVRLASNAGGRATHELRQQRGAQIAADGMITEGPAESQGMYPQLSVTREIHPADCGLNKLGRIQPGQIPSHFGCWSGPACEITGPVENIKPIEGPGMLRFLAPGPGKDSDAWQLIDLQRDRKWLGRGGVKIRASAWFNRVSGAGAG
ncbi:MAG: FecR domain-containing protein, partial [Verrucomicrobia bacterium]|nr:FecR domain-containing protein [Verrucomicrobiota bacterium]